MRKAAPLAKIGVIGGSGLYDVPAVTKRREIRVRTPFGEPSGPVLLGELGGVPCAFLPRHGKGHVLLPGEINGRANIWALKSLGVERVVGVAAVGSLKEEIAPRHFVIPDQLVDRTKHRASTFFGGGIVAHVAFADPFCPALGDALFRACGESGITAHRGGTYVCMEGPAFSTRAESECHRRMGWSVIGMTAVPEAKLAREAELCYANVAMATDYDCWKGEEDVTLEVVLGHLKANTENAQRLIEKVLPVLANDLGGCACRTALSNAIVTRPQHWDKQAAKKLALLVGKYRR